MKISPIHPHSLLTWLHKVGPRITIIQGRPVRQVEEHESEGYDSPAEGEVCSAVGAHTDTLFS